MAKRCPTCGGVLSGPVMLDIDETHCLLTTGEPHRELYRGQDGNWYLTHGGGQVSARVVAALLEQKLIQSVYSNCPDDAYHVGKTLDYEATLAERTKHRRGRDAPLIYTDGTRELRKRTLTTA